MAITLNNTANIEYNYGNETDYANSNLVTTVLAEDASLSAEKISLNTSWRPSENITYLIRIVNTGLEPLYVVTIQDNLGGETSQLLSYVENSAQLYFDDTLMAINPTSITPLTFVLPNELPAGESALISYIAKTEGDIDPEIIEITNNATITGRRTSASGSLVTVTPSPSVTLPIANYADVRVEKLVDKQEIRTGEELTYTLNIRNSGNTDATNIIVSDVLPENFNITSITSETNGVITTFTADEYTIGENNTLTLPTSQTKSITVPANDGTQDGLTIITIVGTITA